MRSTEDTLIGMRDIRAIFKLGRTAAYLLVRRPDFPARIVISARCHRWWASEVDAFAAKLQAQANPQRSAPARRTTVQQREPRPVAAPRRIGTRRPTTHEAEDPS